jgi:hypothetical protein
MRIDAILSPKPHRRRTALAGGLMVCVAACASAAVALAAAQTSAAGKSITKMGPINVTADRLDTDTVHHTFLWTGSAQVSGITKDNMDGLFIDGRAATEADLPNLPKTVFASIKATFDASGHEMERLDAQTKPGAPN